MSYRKKVIEVALPLEATNRESAREQDFEGQRREALDRAISELAGGAV